MKKVEKKTGLEILVWTCKCHGWKYSSPACCLHTARENLIPPRSKEPAHA